MVKTYPSLYFGYTGCVKHISLMRHLDLFSGIGGFALGCRWLGGIDTKFFVEKDEYCAKVLRRNFSGVPIHGDIRGFGADDVLGGGIDLITAGFPCEDLSKCGLQAGMGGRRSSLFDEVFRIADEIGHLQVGYPILVLENVSAVLSGAGGSWWKHIYGSFAERGLSCEWRVIGATDVGAPHRRLRWFCVVYMGDTNGKERKGWEQVPDSKWEALFNAKRADWWTCEPGIPRVADGVSSRVDRCRGLGQALVPQVAMIPLQRAKEIWHTRQEEGYERTIGQGIFGIRQEVSGTEEAGTQEGGTEPQSEEVVEKRQG